MHLHLHLHHLYLHLHHLHLQECAPGCGAPPPPYLQCSNCPLGFPDPWDLMEHVQVYMEYTYLRNSCLQAKLFFFIIVFLILALYITLYMCRMPTPWTYTNCADHRTMTIMTISHQVSHGISCPRHHAIVTNASWHSMSHEKLVYNILFQATIKTHLTGAVLASAELTHWSWHTWHMAESHLGISHVNMKSNCLPLACIVKLAHNYHTAKITNCYILLSPQNFV